MKRDWGAKERDRLATVSPDLTLDTSKQPATVTGIMWLYPEMGYSIELRIPDNYPEGTPWLFCDRNEIPWEIDRHVESKEGMACLCVASEYRKYWPHGFDLAAFLENLVKPFLVGQAYYQIHGHWPPGRERSHGRQGIIEAYEDFLAPLESLSIEVIKHFMRLLSYQNHPKGDEQCPCGSGKQLRKCHRSLVVQLRRSIDPEHAKHDYRLLCSTETSIESPTGHKFMEASAPLNE